MLHTSHTWFLVLSHWASITSWLIQYIIHYWSNMADVDTKTNSWLRISFWSMSDTFNIAISFWHMAILLFSLFCFQGLLLTTIIKPVRFCTVAPFLIYSLWIISVITLMICNCLLFLVIVRVLVFKKLKKHANRKLPFSVNSDPDLSESFAPRWN